jgi:hypothetical protein
MDQDVAPAGVGRTSPCALGGFGFPARAHYGALPLMPAGRGTGERRETAGINRPAGLCHVPGRTVPKP